MICISSLVSRGCAIVYYACLLSYYDDRQKASTFFSASFTLRASGAGRNWNTVTKPLEIAEKLEAHG
jgi:hypothetical protein